MSSSLSTMAQSALCVAPMLFSIVYRFVALFFIEYGAARCSAKCTIVSGFSSLMSCRKRSYSLARSMYTYLSSLPDTSFHVATRTSGVLIGVSELAPSSTSIFRRDRSSMINTSWPKLDR